MVSVQAAIDSLRKAASKCKAKEVKASIENVSSYLIILKSTSAPANVVKKMVTVFRKPLVPIYTAFPALGLQFCAALYAEIFEAQIKDAVESGSATLADKAQWEMVQHSLLSGVLDFLDETQDPDKNKDLAATAFYSVLCDIHFSLSNDGAISQSNGSLIINVYTFLLESAISHPINQHRLRDPKILGGERIGLTLSRCKDFPAVDILLDIFGMLLPSTGNSESGRAKRTRFIQDVLQPFPSNEDLTKTLGDMQSDQWEVTSRKIIDRLANDDISFPQPFQLDQFSSCGCTFGQEEQDRMYLNDMSFTASVSEDEQLEIFRAHYLRVKNVVFSTPSRASTGVTIYLSSPPVLGPAQIEVTGDQVITLSFALKNKDVGKFQKALEHRGLGDSISSTQRKLSLHPPVRMEFDRHGKILPELTVEERALTVQRIFDQGSDSIFSTDAPSPEKVIPEKRLPVPVASPIATKPSLPRPRPVPKGKLSVQQEKTYIDQPLPIVTSTIVTLPRSPLRSLKSPVIALDRSRTAKLTRDVFGASGEELSEVSDDDEPVVSVSVPVPTIAKSPPVPMASLKKHVLSLDHLDDDSDATLFAPPGAVVRRILDSDDEEVLVSARKTNNQSERKKKKMAHAPCTDDEEETGSPPTKQPTATGRTARSRAAKENYSEVITPAALVTKDMEVIDKPGPSKMSAISKYPVPVADRPSGPQTTMPATSDKPTISVKRKNNASDTTNDSETDIRSAKRPRQETPNPPPPPQEPVPAATSLSTRASTAFGPRTAKAAASTRKYGKQGRTSSPVPPPSVAHSDGIDYDELPSAYSPPPSDLPDKALIDLKANVPAVSGRNRISGMKGKAGKANVTVTTIQEGKREKNPPKVAPTPAKTAKPKALATESSKKEKGTKKPDLPAANEPRVTRRSARVATNVIVAKKVDPPPSPEIKRSRATKKPVKAPWEEPDFVSAILPVAAVDELDDDIVPLEQAPEISIPIPAAALSDPVVTDDDPIVSYDQISQDQEDHATGAYEDYLVPTKTDPTPDPPSALGSDYVMIDLSKDDDSPAPKKSPTPLRQPKQPVVLLETKKQPPARSTPPDSPVKIQPAKITPPTPVTLEIERPRQFVTFVSPKKAPSVDKVVPQKNYRRPSPVLQLKKTVEFQDVHYPKMYEPENDYDDETTMYDVDDDRKSKARSEMDDIVDVLSQMQEHIVQNISLRFENVDSQVRMGRDMILRDAAADLHRMRSECVIYFNAIVDLEEEHATFRRKVVAGFEDMQNVNEAMSKQLADIIQRHDRHSLSKRLPTSLFSSSNAPLIAINPALL